MKLIVDTHTLVWMLHDSPELSQRVRVLVRDRGNDVLLSVASAWELSVKYALGKVDLRLPYRQFIDGAIRNLRLTLLQVTIDHLDRVAVLHHHHRDPFDRLLVAQALVEGVPLLSRDSALDAYGVERVW